MLDLPPDHLNMVQQILHEHIPGIEVRAFGSRVNQRGKEYSDLDLAVMGEEKLSKEIYFRLQDAFEESDLPIRVDVLDWHRITTEFRGIIEQGYEIIQQAAR